MLSAIGGAQPLYYLLFTALIIFFCFFYVSIIFNPNEAADNMRKYGGFIPGIRPGKNTADYMNKILTRITVVGGLYLAILSLIPQIMISGIKLQQLAAGIGNWIDAHFPRWLLDGLGVNFYFGGTSLLIVVGVAMDTVNQVEAQLIMRHYEGFTPRAGRIRGRRSSILNSASDDRSKESRPNSKRCAQRAAGVPDPAGAGGDGGGRRLHLGSGSGGGEDDDGCGREAGVQGLLRAGRGVEVPVRAVHLGE